MSAHSIYYAAFKPCRRATRREVLQNHRPHSHRADDAHVSRRLVLSSTPVLLGACTLVNLPAHAITTRLPNPPDGFNRHLDRLDAYSFVYPALWSSVSSTGNDVFFTNPRVADENVFIDISSPSSSKFQSVRDLGGPEDASARLEKTLLREFMSTRLGVQRTVEPISAVDRIGADGKEYYDVVLRVKSYGSRQQLAVDKEQRDEAVVLEFDRVTITTLGTANGRLYQLRVQSPYKRYNRDSTALETMAKSFQCWELDA